MLITKDLSELISNISQEKNTNSLSKMKLEMIFGEGFGIISSGEVIINLFKPKRLRGSDEKIERSGRC